MKPKLNKKSIKKLSLDNKSMLEAFTPQVAGAGRSLPPTNPYRDCPKSKNQTGCYACLPSVEYTCQNGCTTDWG